jgi:hypothetical protein
MFRHTAVVSTLFIFFFCTTLVAAFTRDSRIYEFNLSEDDDRVCVIDPTIYGFDDSIDVSCEDLISLEDFEALQVKTDLNHALDSVIYSGPDVFTIESEYMGFAWLDNCDIATIDEIKKLHRAMHRWRSIIDRTETNLTISNLQGMLHEMVSFVSEADFSVTNIAAGLSLEQNAELSAMMLLPQISYFIESQWAVDMDTVILALNMQAENFRQMGHLEQASLHLLKVRRIFHRLHIMQLQVAVCARKCRW